VRPRLLLALALAAWLLPGAGCQAAARPAALIELSGEAFGTRWHVRLPRDAEAPPPEALAAALRAELDAVDRALSTWRDDSELARFNAATSTAWLPVSSRTADAVAEALAVHARSGGAFDPTVGPLLALWGFGPGGAREGAPAAEAVARARARLGAAELEVRRAPPALRKRRPELALELSGLGEGHAVDALAARLEALGVRRFLVEVGGELRAHGAGPDGRAWRVGIERPVPGAAPVDWVVDLDDAALSTAGTTRHRRVAGGRVVSHVLDPRLGRPVAHALRAVSVRAPRAASADAWATALLVLGPEEGWRVAMRESLAVLFVLERDGRLRAKQTPAFAARAVRQGEGRPVELFVFTFVALVVAFGAMGLGSLAGRAPLRRCGELSGEACEACARPCPRRGRGSRGDART
jgi:thiamine biosynthesis lipoprotein